MYRLADLDRLLNSVGLHPNQIVKKGSSRTVPTSDVLGFKTTDPVSPGPVLCNQCGTIQDWFSHPQQCSKCRMLLPIPDTMTSWKVPLVNTTLRAPQMPPNFFGSANP